MITPRWTETSPHRAAAVRLTRTSLSPFAVHFATHRAFHWSHTRAPINKCIRYYEPSASSTVTTGLDGISHFTGRGHAPTHALYQTEGRRQCGQAGQALILNSAVAPRERGGGVPWRHARPSALGWLCRAWQGNSACGCRHESAAPSPGGRASNCAPRQPPW